MPFYIDAWLKDTRRLNPTTKAAWIDLLCAMWDAPNRGRLNWTLSEYSKHLGITVEMSHEVLSELLDTDTADGHFLNDVSENCPDDCPSLHRGDQGDIRTGVSYGWLINCHQGVTLISRRMKANQEVRDKNKERQQKSRSRRSDSRGRHRSVTEESPGRSQKSEVISKNKRGEESQPSPEGRRSAQVLSDKIFENHPSRTAPTEAVLMEWSREADRIYKIDKHGWEEILSLIEWSQVDPFWKTNILSMSKFRKQWNQLTAHRSRGGEHEPKGSKGLESLKGWAGRLPKP